MMTGPVVTYSALTTLASQKRAEKLARLVEGTDPAPIGVGVFLIEDGSGWCEVGAYFSDKPDDLALDLLAAAVGARPFVISEVPDQDWVAHVRRELSPVIAGRFFVHGAHDAGEVPSGAVALKIEASMAFGTGHHGTTLGCLSAFDELLTAGGRPKSIADIGCGTAILAMAAAKSLADALSWPVILMRSRWMWRARLLRQTTCQSASHASKRRDLIIHDQIGRTVRPDFCQYPERPADYSGPGYVPPYQRRWHADPVRDFGRSGTGRHRNIPNVRIQSDGSPGGLFTGRH